jgi:hypothetical protein
LSDQCLHARKISKWAGQGIDRRSGIALWSPLATEKHDGAGRCCCLLSALYCQQHGTLLILFYVHHHHDLPSTCTRMMVFPAAYSWIMNNRGVRHPPSMNIGHQSKRGLSRSPTLSREQTPPLGIPG